MNGSCIIRMWLVALMIAPTTWATPLKGNGFDHSVWNELLAEHVVPVQGGKSTTVDYQGMQAHSQTLATYLQGLSVISQAQFDQWPKAEQLAFLINAYNAATVQLIVNAWPELDSIKDLGGFFSSPWGKQFVVLLDKTRTLDDIEHGLIRGSGRYNDPRIHFAVNCASIGCPALRAEAYVASQLDQQLDEQTTLFLSDSSRNRVHKQTLQLSSIFKWYREDFEKGWQGFNRLEDFLLTHADALGLSTSMAQALSTGQAEMEFLNYDWRLNKK